MNELMFQADVKGMSERSELIPCIIIIILSVTFVCDVRQCDSEREVTGSHLTRAKQFSFSSSLDLDVTRGSPLTQLAMALAAN